MVDKLDGLVMVGLEPVGEEKMLHFMVLYNVLLGETAPLSCISDTGKQILCPVPAFTEQF